jgi:hypothetical protein
MKNYIVKSIILTVLYLSIFSIVYLVHINFFKTDVILYSAFLDSILSIIIFAVIFFLSKFSNNYSNFEISQIFIIFILIGYSASISLPTVIDRSLSFYILEKIDTYNGSVKTSSLRDIFVNDYIDEYKLVEVRITEQVASGTIELLDGCIYLTNKGKFIASFSSFFRKNLLAKKRLLLNEYTDVLTDPLKDSVLNEDYVCNTINQN